jgi:hypothetical protein
MSPDSTSQRRRAQRIKRQLEYGAPGPRAALSASGSGRRRGRRNAPRFLMTKDDLRDKYLRLVWYARKSPELLASRSDIAAQHASIAERYPQETEALHGERGDWQHGFHSGMLAALRLVSGGVVKQHEWDDFPMLDS